MATNGPQSFVEWQARLPGSVPEVSPKRSVTQRSGIGSSRCELGTMPSNATKATAASPKKASGGSTCLPHHGTVTGSSLVTSAQASGRQPSFSHVPNPIPATRQKQQTMSYVAPLMSRESQESSNTQNNAAMQPRDNRRQMNRCARSPPPSSVLHVARAGGSLRGPSRGRTLGAIGSLSASIGRTASPKPREAVPVRTCSTTVNDQPVRNGDIDKSFTQVSFCAALPPSSPFLGAKILSPQTGLRPETPQPHATNVRSASRSVAVPMIHFNDDSTKVRSLSRERHRQVHIAERIEQQIVVPIPEAPEERSVVTRYVTEEPRTSPAMAARVVQTSHSVSNLPVLETTVVRASPKCLAPRLTDASRSIVAYSPSSSVRSGGTLDPNPPSEYTDSRKASPLRERASHHPVPAWTANSSALDRSPSTRRTCVEGQTAALVAEANAQADKSAALVNEATAKALEEALARVKQLEIALGEERRTVAELKDTFATELMNQQNANERDIKALEEIIAKLMSDNGLLNALLEKYGLDSKDLVASCDPTSSSSKDVSPGRDNIEKPFNV